MLSCDSKTRWQISQQTSSPKVQTLIVLNGIQYVVNQWTANFILVYKMILMQLKVCPVIFSLCNTLSGNISPAERMLNAICEERDIPDFDVPGML